MEMDASVLIVEDDDSVRDTLAQFLERDYNINAVSGVKEALEALSTGFYDVVLTDKNMPDTRGGVEGGMELLRHIRQDAPEIDVIVMTGFATIQTAIEAMKLGAFDYVPKPFSPEVIKKKIARIMEYRSFLNPERVIAIYKGLHNNLLEVFKTNTAPGREAAQRLLADMEEKIDHFFRMQKDWETVLINQREALGRIAHLAENLKERVDLPEDATGMLDEILTEANRRI